MFRETQGIQKEEKNQAASQPSSLEVRTGLELESKHTALPSYLNRQILKKELNFPLCLAPMVGLSHYYLRHLVRRYLPEDACTLWPTEMLNSRRLPSEDLKATPETKRSEVESELVPQILGNEEVYIAPSVEKLKHWGAEGIDINMGCPVKRALKHNYGVSLMGDSDYAASVVEMTVKNTSLPVSVKLRAGFNEDPRFLINFVKKLESAGAQWITLHPRLAIEKRRGVARWPQIKLIREELKIPVIGNGDVQTHEDVLEMLRQTQCDMVMSGRALAARPWMMWQVGEAYGFKPPQGMSQKPPYTPIEEGAEYGRALLFLINLMREEEPAQNLALRKIRFFIKTTHPWLHFGHNLFTISQRASDLNQLYDLVGEFFSQPQSMSPRTQLRE